MSGEVAQTSRSGPPILRAVVLVASVVLSALWLWTMRMPQESYMAIAQIVFRYVVVIGAIAAASIICRNRPGRFQVTFRQAIALFTVFGITLGVVFFARRHDPVRICFRLSRSEMDQLADSVAIAAAPGISRVDRFVGNYFVQSAERWNDAIILRIEDAPNPHFEYGFIRIPNLVEGAPIGEDYGLPECWFDHLSGDWYVFYSGYMAVKTGWS